MTSHPKGKCTFTSENILKSKDLAENYIDNLEYLVHKKVKIVHFPVLGSPLCTFKRENELIISPDGALYKCISAIGLEEFKICDKEMLFEKPEKYIVSLASLLENERKDAECAVCKYLPIYEGGCHYNASVDNIKKDCQKEFYNHIWKRLLLIISKLEQISYSNIWQMKGE